MTAMKTFMRCLALTAAATLMVASANAECWFEIDEDGDREQICETLEYDEDGDVEVREFTDGRRSRFR